MKALAKAYEKFCQVELGIGAAFLLITVLVITLSAILRTIGYPINWALDVALLLFTWSVFLGADTALRADKMVNVDFILRNLKEPARKIVQLSIYILILVFLVTMVYLGIRLSISSRHRSFQGIPNLSYTWATLSIPVPFFFMIITTSIKVRQLFVKSEPSPVDTADHSEAQI